jgi:hypothetical protein
MLNDKIYFSKKYNIFIKYFYQNIILYILYYTFFLSKS